MEEAAQILLQQVSILASPPTNGRYFMVLDDYGRGQTAPQGERFKQTIFSGLNQFHMGLDPISANKSGPKLNVAYVDFSTIWNGVLGPDPGFKAFGYTNTDSCTQCYSYGCTTDGMCDDPEHYFYWIPGCVFYFLLPQRRQNLTSLALGILRRRQCVSWQITSLRFCFNAV